MWSVSTVGVVHGVCFSTNLYLAGAGTYQFNYSVYQLNEEKTYISTNLGDKGNAHSEYLGP